MTSPSLSSATRTWSRFIIFRTGEVRSKRPSLVRYHCWNLEEATITLSSAEAIIRVGDDRFFSVDRQWQAQTATLLIISGTRHYVCDAFRAITCNVRSPASTVN